MNEIITRLVDIEPNTRAFHKEDYNGDYNIYISVHLSYEMRMQAYLHELEHIRLNHLHSEEPVEVLEAEVGF